MFSNFLKAVAEFSKAIGEWTASKDKRYMKACIEAGEKYIQVNEGSGEYASFDEARKKKFLRHYRKRFFRYN